MISRKLLTVVRAATAINNLNASLPTSTMLVRKMASHYPANWKSPKQLVVDTKATMDDIPLANIPYEDYHCKQNSKWNIQLGASVAFFLFTIIAMHRAGVFLFYGPPPMKNPK